MSRAETTPLFVSVKKLISWIKMIDVSTTNTHLALIRRSTALKKLPAVLMGQETHASVTRARTL